MDDAIIFLGVNDLQKNAILNAKLFGFRCIGFDRNKYAKSQKYCDHFYNIDSTDISALFSKINTHKVNVKGIWANNDILIPTRLVLAHILGTKDTDIITGINMLDKLSFRDFVGPKKYFIPWVITENDKKCPLDFPVITKPVVGGGSQGIKIINNLNEYSTIDITNPVLIEAFIDGIELGINLFSNGKQVYRLGAVFRYFDHSKHHIPIGTITEYDNELLDKSYEVVEDYISELNYYGMVKADILIDSEKQIYLIELSPRFHGEIDTEHIFSYLDNSLSKQYFKFLKNDIMDNKKIVDEYHYGYISLFLYGFETMPELDISKLPIGDFHDIELLQHLQHRYVGDYINYTPRSTYDIVIFSIFRSKLQLSNAKFSEISNQLNKSFNKMYEK